nr:MAG TPA: hypothetical protein [Caudoviricetes sp.]
MIDHLVLTEPGGLFYLPQKYFLTFFNLYPHQNGLQISIW